ncbi:DnaJ-domain-containing protein [Marasmius fiardii PR-910]|nr:DnaJ-domain-containing protein [Marasmius fiardii PR-910]
MNKDEALRCLAISQKHRDARNYSSARKFCQKSIALFDTPEAHKLLESIEAAEGSASSSANDEGSTSPAGASTATEEHPSASGTKHRHTRKESKAQTSSNGTAGGLGGENREYTTDQMEVVRRVRSCKVTEFYEILAVKKDCDEADIKKAYRKLALALHPDKNGAPGADEAFKMVSKAFQILSDPQKRAIHDQSGSDPEDRYAGMSSRGFSSTSFAGGGPSFDGEISPEDLFNMFFGGGNPAFGGGFGGGPTVFTFSSGGGFRSFQTFPNGRREQANANVEPRSFALQLLPLIILFGFSLLSALPNLFTTPPVPHPRYSFQPTSRYSTERHTLGKGVKYHINPSEVMNHPVIGPELQREGIDLKQRNGKKDEKVQLGPAFSEFEKSIENSYINEVYMLCQRGLDRKERTDWEKVRKIQEEVIESCVELEKLGIRR